MNVKVAATATATVALKPAKVAKTVKVEPAKMYDEVMGCRVVRQPFAMGDMAKIIKGLPASAMFGINLAKRMGAVMVLGTPENLAKLEKSVKLEGSSFLEEKWRKKLGESASAWVENGSIGASSNYMLFVLKGFNADAWLEKGNPLERPSRVDHPHDPDDMTRCRKLLEAAPELKLTFDKMASRSPQWSVLVRHWNAICQSMDKETPEWRNPKPGTSSPKTYGLMRGLFMGALAAAEIKPKRSQEPRRSPRQSV